MEGGIGVDSDRITAGKLNNGGSGWTGEAVGPAAGVTPVPINGLPPAGRGDGDIRDDGDRNVRRPRDRAGSKQAGSLQSDLVIASLAEGRAQDELATGMPGGSNI